MSQSRQGHHPLLMLSISRHRECRLGSLEKAPWAKNILHNPLDLSQKAEK